MLTKMQAFGPRPSVPELPLSGPGADGDPIQIRGITGLGPVQANVNTTPFGSVPGESFNGTTKGKRNIVLTLGLNPDWQDQTIASLRQMLYGYFMTGNSCKLRFFCDDLPDCEIHGYVETMEPNIFSKDPEMQISIICPLPDFIAVEPTIETGVVGDGTSPTTIDYPGNVSTGFVLQIDYGGAGTTDEGLITIVNKTPLEHSFGVVADVDSTQYFKMSSVQGQKYAHNVRIADGVITNRLRNLSPVAEWPQLEPGLNEFTVLMDDDPGHTWTMAFFARFGAL